MRTAALHHLTVRTVAPAQLPAIAAAAGFREVCLFTHVPAVTLTGSGGASAPFPLVTAQNAPAVAAALREHGVGVINCEYFPVSATVPVGNYRDALALGAQLGARRAVTHIHDTDSSRAVDRLGQLADLAAEYGLGLGLEFMGLSPACNSIARAAWYARQVGRANLGIAIDALHLIRTGGSPDDVRALPGELIAYAQLCDGASLRPARDYRGEALDRLMPGGGIFPLVEIVRALPLTTDLDIEVPCAAESDALAPLDRACTAQDAARRLFMQAAQPS